MGTFNLQKTCGLMGHAIWVTADLLHRWIRYTAYVTFVWRPIYYFVQPVFWQETAELSGAINGLQGWTLYSIQAAIGWYLRCVRAVVCFWIVGDRPPPIGQTSSRLKAFAPPVF